ncbi:NADH:flavin oxidoreductase/NADH oxidase family protein [Thalassotalea sp. LPB0316]|uniref:NADH:flavin oxidoreductase/NADH oxidase family protein n=1 Tax=Thalassotalea sp. LPB0316 TaxID=2769490 RepID=UPI0018693BE5|nr:NADH:flavin oxidoreductase/NADH oxidase family protein [Thalassotalea sp. LPB0316]QOL25332.1 NADH:flavin oxidoreductase/NADH oxidase family protein [Thalassotalea sp. LPB0316]
MANQPFEKLTLASGLTLKNRCVKAAMEESLGNTQQLPDREIERLYQKWSNGGVGLIITGNVMIDKLAMTGPGGLVLENEGAVSAFAKQAKAGQHNDCKIVMQINHPGRQVYKKMQGKVLSPSAIPLDLGKHSSLFGVPKAMNENEIMDVIKRFITTALLAEKAGFNGIQVHAAHGYLISQFLSPLVNKRDDQWGGSLNNRARLLLEVVSGIKAAVSSSFSVSVKLNSADFQRGGFDVDEAEQVVAMLGNLGVDFVELSGGSYEAAAMQGVTKDGRTLEREAYFLSFAQQIAKSATIPIMTTGGVTQLATVERVLEQNIALVGIASALAFQPDLINQWQLQPDFQAKILHPSFKDKTLHALTTMAIIRRQLIRLGEGKSSQKSQCSLISLVRDQLRSARLTKRYLRNNSTLS